MIRLDEGNVLLKPSHRRHLSARLRRLARQGQRVGDFLLTINLHRSGRAFEARATLSDSAGKFACRCRNQQLNNALAELVTRLTGTLHAHRVERVAARA